MHATARVRASSSTHAMTFHNTMAEIGLSMNHTYGFLGVTIGVA
jgi:hypothetical protein